MRRYTIYYFVRPNFSIFPGDISDNDLFILQDQIGSSVARLSASGTIIDEEEYYPFGDSSLRTFTYKRYRYVGKEKDRESGLYYYGARYYAAWTCRFISIDPLASDYPFYTPYNYAGNKPINKIDIDGMQEPGAQKAPNAGNFLDDLVNRPGKYNESPVQKLPHYVNATGEGNHLQLLSNGPKYKDPQNKEIEVGSGVTNLVINKDGQIEGFTDSNGRVFEWNSYAKGYYDTGKISNTDPNTKKTTGQGNVGWNFDELGQINDLYGMAYSTTEGFVGGLIIIANKANKVENIMEGVKVINKIPAIKTLGPASDIIDIYLEARNGNTEKALFKTGFAFVKNYIRFSSPVGFILITAIDIGLNTYDLYNNQ